MNILAEDLRELRRLKDIAEENGLDKKDADAYFKQFQGKVVERMRHDECASFREPKTSYVFTVVDRVKGQVEDRRLYVRWALENDPGIQEFLNTMAELLTSVSCRDAYEEWETAFFDAIMNTSIVKYKEDGHVMNQQARAHIDDKAPLPPGLTFRPDPYVSMVKS